MFKLFDIHLLTLYAVFCPKYTGKPVEIILKRKLSSIVIQGLIITLVALIMGFTANLVRSDGIPIVEKARMRTVAGVVKIDLDKSKELFDKGKAVFVDARTPAEYGAGHIKNAINLPYEQFESLFIDTISHFDLKTPIVAYCSGESCHSSDEIARLLFAEGYKEVYVFFGGWPAWVGKEYPTNKIKIKPLYSLE